MTYLHDGLNTASAKTFRGFDRRLCSALLGTGCLVLFSAFLSGCSKQDADEDTSTVGEGVSVPPGSLTLTNYLSPNNLNLKHGKASQGSLSALAVQDQTGNQDTPADYISFQPDQSGVSAIFRFTVPTSVDPTKITTLALLANFRGDAKATAVWRFQLYNVTSSQWSQVGDNASAKSGIWSSMAFEPQGSLQSFIGTSGEVQVRFITQSTTDPAALDYLAVGLDVSSATPPPPPPPPPGGPSWLPTPGTSWQMQLSGTLDTSLNVKAYDFDLYDATKSVTDALHARGIKVICYFSGGADDTSRPDASSFPKSVIGLEQAGWPGSYWIDVRQVSILEPIMTARMDLAVQHGCDGVGIDNLEGWANNTGFTITAAQQITYNTMIAQQAHMRGLTVGITNDLSQAKDMAPLFDFTINEECFVYNECNLMQPFLDLNKAVFEIEYTGSSATICPQANSMNLDTLFKNRNLDAYRVSCR